MVVCKLTWNKLIDSTKVVLTIKKGTQESSFCKDVSGEAYVLV